MLVAPAAPATAAAAPLSLALLSSLAQGIMVSVNSTLDKETVKALAQVRPGGLLVCARVCGWVGGCCPGNGSAPRLWFGGWVMVGEWVLAGEGEYQGFGAGAAVAGSLELPFLKA